MRDTKLLSDLLDSAPEQRPARARKGSAVLTQRQLDSARPGVERAFGAALLLLSVAGTIVAFHARPPEWDGWAALAGGAIDPLLVLAGLGVQGACTLVQWLYRRRRSWLRRAALTLDAGATVLGYAPLLIAPLSGIIGWLTPANVAGWLAWLILIVAAYALAYAPEGVLID